jgi:hypothetical protein
LSERDRRALAEGMLNIWFDDEGRFHLTCEAPLDEGLIIEAALRDARDRLFRSGDTRVTMFDALVECCRHWFDSTTGTTGRPARATGWATADQAERDGSDGSDASNGNGNGNGNGNDDAPRSAAHRSSHGDRFRIYLHLDTEGAWVNQGPRVPAPLLDKLIAQGSIQPLWLTDGRPISVGRATRVVSPHLRRRVLDRDVGCRTPGCSSIVGLDAHHIAWWHRDHGATDTDNLAALCRRCHSTVHRGDMTIEGNADVPNGLVFKRADGTVIRGAASPVPPTGQPPTPGQPYQRPTGERLDRRWVWFSDPPPSDLRTAS